MSDEYGALREAMERLAAADPEAYADNPDLLAQAAQQAAESVGWRYGDGLDLTSMAEDVLDTPDEGHSGGWGWWGRK